LKLTAQYGSSGYWIDFVVQHPTQPGRYVLAIECDGATYHSSESARDRDRLRQEQLERLGWTFHRIWSSEWFYDKEHCAHKAIEAFEQAVRRANADEKEDDKRPTERSSAARPLQAGEDIAARVRETFGRSVRKGNQHSSASSRPRNRPSIRPGLPIDEYYPSPLTDLAKWILSGDEIYTDDELLVEMMRELDFQRRGSKIVTKLNAAIRRARKAIRPRDQ
jgi:very-short-patch-repair endonuclease